MRERLIAILWIGGGHARIGSMLVSGLAVWLLYSTVQVLVNGPVLDETVVPAQIIARAVEYPASHPHEVYYRQAFNLVNYLAAGLWVLRPDPLLLSAVRNVCFLFLSTFVPFAFALLLTGKPMWGHAAAALTLTGAGLRFHGLYPMWVFPGCYSHGHIGLHFALLTVALLLARLWRTGGFLIGVLPAVHPAMALIVWPWSAVYVLFSKARPCGSERRGFIIAVSTGVAVCAVLGLWLHTQVPGPGASVAAGDATAAAVYRNFTAYVDLHRQPTPVLALGYLANAVAALWLGFLLLSNHIRSQDEGSKSRAGVSAWVLVFCVAVWLYVFGSTAFERLTGWFPPLLRILMPNRFSNLSAVLLAPLTVATFACVATPARYVRTALPALFIVLLIVAGTQLADRPVTVEYHVMAAGWGLLAGATVVLATTVRARAVNISNAAVVGLALWLGQNTTRTAACYGAAIVFTVAVLLVVRRLAENPSFKRAVPAWTAPGLLAACLLIAIVSLGNAGAEHERLGKRWDVISDFDHELDHWLRQHAGAGEFILPAIHLRGQLQAKTGHPVLLELETVYLMSYMPKLASGIGSMIRDLAGVDMADAAAMERLAVKKCVPLTAQVWRDAWTKRSLEEWQALRRKYNFRFIVASSDQQVNLPVALPGKVLSLYSIP